MLHRRFKAALLCGSFLTGAAGPGLLALAVRPAAAQNVTCATRAPGDSSNACASTAFVNNLTFTSGRPWCDPRGFGAKGDATTDDIAAFNSCVTVLSALNGGILYVTQGYYCLKSGGGLTLPVSIPIEVIGVAEQATTLSTCNVDQPVVTIAGSLSVLQNISIIGKGANNDTTTFGATANAIDVASTAGGVRLINVRVSGGLNGVKWSGNDGTIFGGNYTQGYNSNLLVQGSNSAGLKVEFASFDQGFPVSTPAKPVTANPWANGTPYVAGQIVSIVQGGVTYYIQAANNGTSGGSQPTLKNYGIPIVDNTVNWQLSAPANGYAIQCDTACFELFVKTSDIGYVGAAAVGLTNTLAGTPPANVSLLQNRINAFGTDVLLTSGANVDIIDNLIYGCFLASCSGIGTNASFTGVLQIAGNHFEGVQGTNVNITVGTLTSINGNYFSGGNLGVDIAANLNSFQVNDNKFTGVTGNITVEAGTSNHYRILGNVYATGPSPIDGGTGTDKVVDRTSRMTIGTVQTGDLSPATGTAYWQNSALSGAVATNYAIIQNNVGATAINAPTGQVVDFRINNSQAWRLDSDQGFWANGVTGSSKGAGTFNALNYYTQGVINLIPLESTTDFFVNSNTGGTASCKDGTLTCGAGNDTTGNGSQATPWSTIQKCVDEVSGKYFIRKAQVTCWVADNAAIAQAVILRPYQANQLYQGLQPAIRGNCTTPGNVVLKGASTGAIFSVAAMSNAWTIQGFDLNPTSAGDTGVFVDEYAQVNIGNMRWTGAMSIGLTTRYQSFTEFVANGGAITCAGSLTISANQAAFINAFANSTVLGQGGASAVTMTLTGTPAFSNAWVVVADGGYVDLQSFAYVGSASAGTSRYNAANGHVAPAGTTMPGGTAGLSYLYVPGSTSGQAAIVCAAVCGTPTWTLTSTGGNFASQLNNLSVFAATTSAQLFGVISDETGGTGVLVGSVSPTFTGTVGAADITATGTVRANTGFSANGNVGLNVTTTVRAAGGAADCTLTFTFGLKTGGTC